MDRRLVFFLVFCFTLISTVLVGAVCLLKGASLMATALYSLATMWVVGISSQLLFQNLYQAIVKPIEDDRQEKRRSQVEEEINLQDVEEIDEATQRIREQEKKKILERAKKLGRGDTGGRSVGVE